MAAVSPSLISESDAIGMVSILSRVASLVGDHNEKKRTLMDGLCDLVEADFWIWGVVAGCNLEKPLVYTSLNSGGFTEKQLSKLLVSLENEALSLSFRQNIKNIVDSGSQVTQLHGGNQQTTSDHDEKTRVNWREVNLSPPLICYRPIRDDGMSKVRLYRRWGSAPFSLQQLRIIDIVLGEVGWLHDFGWTSGSPALAPKLPRRSRMVLDLLLEGLTRKEIANRISLSIHTVNDHVKHIYSVYSVHSHAELLNRIHSEKH